MNTDKYIKLFIAVVITISLIMNFTLLSSVDRLENQMYSISNNQHNILNNVNNQKRNIQNVMNDFKKEQSWISTINVDVNREDLKDGQVEVTFEWQVKELHRNSDVFFNYVYGDNEEYTSVPAEELQQGLFRVNVPFDVNLEPKWDVSILTSYANSEKEVSKRVMEEKRIEEHQQSLLKYFVSASSENMLKSGEIQTEFLGHFGADYYGVVQTHINMSDENFNVNMTNHNVNRSSIVTEKAYLLTYQGETFLGEEELQLIEHNQSNRPTRSFNSNKIKQYEDMKLVIKVVYSNGETFEKEVY